MTVDLRHNVVAGLRARLPGHPRPGPTRTRSCRSRGTRTSRGASPTWSGWTATPYGVDSRGAVLRGRSPSTLDLGLTPVIGPGARVLSVRARPDRAERLPPLRRQRQPRLHRRPRRGPARRAARDARTRASTWGWARIAANHEFGRSQYEINLAPLRRARRRPTGPSGSRRGQGDGGPPRPPGHVHREALERRRGLRLPPAPVAGRRARQRTLLNDAAGPEGISQVGHHFIAGLLEHGPALMAFFNPTTNAYRRIHEEALVPTLVSWGHDNRLCLARVPRERGRRHPGRAAAGRRRREPLPGRRRRALRRPRRHQAQARAAGADGGPDLRAARGREDDSAAALVRGRARGARRRRR